MFEDGKPSILWCDTGRFCRLDDRLPLRPLHRHVGPCHDHQRNHRDGRHRLGLNVQSKEVIQQRLIVNAAHLSQLLATVQFLQCFS